MPTITIQQTLSASQALTALVKVKRPMLGALKMRQLARVIGAQLESYESERRKLLELYGDHDAEGKLKEENSQILFADDAARACFAADLGELLLATWECGVTLTAKDFGSERGNCPHCRKELPEKPLEVEPELLLWLGDLFEELEPPKAAPASGKD